MHRSFLWVSCLDPRMSQCAHLTEEEKDRVRSRLISEASRVQLTSDTDDNDNDNVNASTDITNANRKEQTSLFSISNIQGIQASTAVTTTSTMDNTRTEVLHYLNKGTTCNDDTDPLVW